MRLVYIKKPQQCFNISPKQWCGVFQRTYQVCTVQTAGCGPPCTSGIRLPLELWCFVGALHRKPSPLVIVLALPAERRHLLSTSASSGGFTEGKALMKLDSPCCHHRNQLGEVKQCLELAWASSFFFQSRSLSVLVKPVQHKDYPHLDVTHSLHELFSEL